MNRYNINPVKNCIVIIDKCDESRKALSNILTILDAAEAKTIEEGIEAIKENAEKLCGVIIGSFDYEESFELLGTLKEKGIADMVPVFLVCDWFDEAFLEKAYGFGVADVLLKPFTPAVIKHRIKKAAGVFQTRETMRKAIAEQRKAHKEKDKALEMLRKDTVEAIAATMELHDGDLGVHGRDIYYITKYILKNTDFGKEYDDKEIEEIAMCSVLHDVGKIAIPDVILNKAGKYTDEEYEVVKMHTIKGWELLEKITELDAYKKYWYASDIARHHHERWDGNGYPDGLKEDEISPWTQVVSIADVYDALINGRIYKRYIEPEKVVKMIEDGECGAFNPELIRCFKEVEPEIRKWYLYDKTDKEKNKELQYNGRSIKPLREATDMIFLTTAIKSVYDMIISANLTKNRYYTMDYDSFKNYILNAEGDFDDMIEASSTNVLESHRQLFIDTFSRESLMEAYQNGITIVELEYPEISKTGEKRWIFTVAILMEDMRTGDIVETTFCKCVDDVVEKISNKEDILIKK